MLSRRDLFKKTGLVTGGLVIEMSLGGCATPFPHSQSVNFEPNAWLQITPHNQIIFYLNSVEMGQGSMTGMATLIAEELNTAPEEIEVQFAGLHPDYVNPFYGVQVTGGSTSVRVYYEQLRVCAAQAREMLRQAAANELGASLSDIDVLNKHIIYRDSQIPLGRFVASASKLNPPNVELKHSDQFRFIGKPRMRLDSKAKSMGVAQFGIDVDIDGLQIAVLKRCPVIGGTVKAWHSNDAESSLAVKRVVVIPNGVAVVADSYWHAQQALKKITVEWHLPELAQRSTADIQGEFAELARTEEGRSAHRRGDTDAQLAAAQTVYSAEYRVPYLAHATMEPMNCTVVLNANHCDIWVPTQVPSVCAAIAEEITGLNRADITVNTTFLGGGFGRRLNADYVFEAVHIAKASGLPIKLVFSREDDMQHDFYRPAAHSVMKAGLDEEHRITAWYHKNVNPNIMTYAFQEFAPAILPAWFPDGLARSAANLGPYLFGKMLMDPASTEGALEFGYDSGSVDIRHVQADPGLRTGYWRSVGHSLNAFFVESFVDELAHQVQQDPLGFRINNLHNNPRMANLLTRLGELSGWGAAAFPGASQGVAGHYSFGSYVAQVVEASVDHHGINVHRVVVMIDCGKVVNPDIVKAQMEGGVIFGLTAALYGEITLEDGVVEQSNFNNYPLLRINESPEIEVHIMPSNEAPGGAGEPGVPPIAPALANAIYAATGRRLRQLPLGISV